MNTPGQVFDAEVIQSLRRVHACDVRASRRLDYLNKCDGEVVSIARARLKRPVQLQITRRVDHYGKLNAYLSSRQDGVAAISLYVEVHEGPAVNAVSEHLAWAAREVQGMTPYQKGKWVFGLRIDDEDAVFFDPYERREELQRQREAPAWIGSLRVGRVNGYEDNGFWIMDEERNKQYFAHYIDAYDAPIRKRLLGKRHRIPVLFKPTGVDRATDVRAR